MYCCPASAQYYITGEVLDSDKQPIQNAKIYIPLTRGIYYSGGTGGFGIPSAHLTDSMVITKDGYDSLKIRIRTKQYQVLILQKSAADDSRKLSGLVSLTKGIEGPVYPMSYYRDESYQALIENDFIPVNKKYNTAFSMRIDKASYSNIRRFINQSTRVPPDAVRIDELLNYFSFNYTQPAPGADFHVSSALSDCPWNPEHALFYLTVSAKKLSLESVPPSNFVFLIDVSGSMDQPSRLPLLKEAFQLLIKNLRTEDTVSVVVYGGHTGVWLPPTGGAEKETISKSIEELNAWGDTPGEAAIRMAYKLARNNFIQGGNNRIILATDGDFNVGQTSEKELEQLISKEKESGIYLTCLGVGMGNYKDSKIEVLARKGNGNFAYIDDIREAEKVLVTEFTQTLYSVAGDVVNTISFDTTVVREYRLIGYENKRSVLSEKTPILEGGDIGSGAGNTIIFELIPVSPEKLKKATGSLAHLQISYHRPGIKALEEINYTSAARYVPFDQLIPQLRFATAVGMYGLKLRESVFLPDIAFEAIKNIAVQAYNPNSFLETGFIDMIDKTKQIYTEKRRRKK